MNVEMTDLARAPWTKKPPVPRMILIAARIAAGENLDAVAAEYERTGHAIRRRLNDAGFSAATGLPVEAPVKPAPLLPFDRQPWADEALCMETDPESFFPEQGASSLPAKRVCKVCPVRAACLDHALATDERWGIRGGMTPSQRKRLKKKGVA